MIAGMEMGGSKHKQRRQVGTSLVVLWLRMCLPMQGTWVQSLVREDSICCRATSLCATILSFRARDLQQEKPLQSEA